MRARILLLVVALAPVACSAGQDQIFAPVEAGDHAAALLVADCTRDLEVVAIDLRPLPAHLEVPEDCDPDAPLTLLLYEQSLDELEIPPGPLPPASCKRDDTAWDTCCTPESLPSSNLVLEATPSSSRFEPRPGLDLPQGVASFRHNARCPCRSFRRQPLFSERASGFAIFPDEPDAFFVAIGRRDEPITDIYHSTIESVRQGTGLGTPIGQLDIQTSRGTALASGRWMIWDGQGSAWVGRLDESSERIRDPLMSRIENWAASTEGTDEVIFARRVGTGTSTFARFDGAMESLTPDPPPIVHECSDIQADGGEDGQESVALWLGPAHYIVGPEHVVGGIHPDGYWHHEQGRTDWVELDSPSGCMTSLGVLEDGRLIRATGNRRFETKEEDGWSPVEIIDGPNGVSGASSEVRITRGYRGGFVFSGNNGMIGSVNRGLLCDVVELGTPHLRDMVRVGDVIFAGGGSALNDERDVYAAWMFWPED